MPVRIIGLPRILYIIGQFLLKKVAMGTVLLANFFAIRTVPMAILTINV